MVNSWCVNAKLANIEGASLIRITAPKDFCLRVVDWKTQVLALPALLVTACFGLFRDVELLTFKS